MTSKLILPLHLLSCCHNSAPYPPRTLLLRPSNYTEMRTLSIIFAPLLLALVRSSPTPTPITTTNITESAESPDLVASWSFQGYSDGGCNTRIVEMGGNTPTTCSNTPQLANSFRFISTTDPQTRVSFAVDICASQGCGNRLDTDNGKSSSCQSITFESWQVSSTIG